MYNSAVIEHRERERQALRGRGWPAGAEGGGMRARRLGVSGPPIMMGCDEEVPSPHQGHVVEAWPGQYTNQALTWSLRVSAGSSNSGTAPARSGEEIDVRSSV